MSLLRSIRSAVTFPSPFAGTSLVDVRMQDRSIETIRGNATRFELGFFTPAGVALDLSEVESLNLKIQPDQATASPLADQTILAEDLDLTMDAASWEDGTKQHAIFEFTNAEMNLPVGGTVKSFWIVLTAITVAGNEVTLFGGGIVFHEDNNAAGDPPPENAGTFLTLEQGDARYFIPGPQGETGEQGEQGEPGAPGAAGSGLEWVTIDEEDFEALDPKDPDIIYDVLIEGLP